MKASKAWWSPLILSLRQFFEHLLCVSTEDRNWGPHPQQWTGQMSPPSPWSLYSHRKMVSKETNQYDLDFTSQARWGFPRPELWSQRRSAWFPTGPAVFIDIQKQKDSGMSSILRESLHPHNILFQSLHFSPWLGSFPVVYHLVVSILSPQLPQPRLALQPLVSTSWHTPPHRSCWPLTLLLGERGLLCPFPPARINDRAACGSTVGISCTVVWGARRSHLRPQRFLPLTLEEANLTLFETNYLELLLTKSLVLNEKLSE